MCSYLLDVFLRNLDLDCLWNGEEIVCREVEEKNLSSTKLLNWMLQST